MVEVVELFLPLDGEEAVEIGDVEGVSSFWHRPSAAGSVFDGEIHRRHCRRRSNGMRSRDGGNFASSLRSPQISISFSSSRRLGLQIPSDSDSEADYSDERVALALDLFDRCSLPRDSGGDGVADPDPSTDARDPFSFGVFDEVEEMRADYLELNLGLGSRFGDEKQEEAGDDHGVVDFSGEEGSDWDRDGLLFRRSIMVSESSGGRGESSILRDDEGLRIGSPGSDSNSGEEEEVAAVSPNFGGGAVVTDDASLPLCWDCLPVDEDRRDPNEEFEWEEIDGRVVERDNSNADLEFDAEDQDESVQNIEWEVLLAMNTLERNASVEHEDQDGFVYASEYEVLFGQFAENSNIKGTPPAAKSVIEHLPSIVLTQVDVTKNNTLCAVCKEEMSSEEEAKELPCSHHYHEECILHWLRLRNTCPVCRHELPTDDPDYEKQRARRTLNDGALTQ